MRRMRAKKKRKKEERRRKVRRRATENVLVPRSRTAGSEKLRIFHT